MRHGSHASLTLDFGDNESASFSKTRTDEDEQALDVGLWPRVTNFLCHKLTSVSYTNIGVMFDFAPPRR